MARTRSQRVAEVTAKVPGLTALPLALYLVACAVASGIVLYPAGPLIGEHQNGQEVGVNDVALAAVILTQLPALATLWRERSRHRCALGAIVLAVSFVPALAAHPSTPGLAAEFRLVGVAMFTLGAGRLVAGRGRDLLLVAFASVTAVHMLVALAERAVDGRLGLGPLGEPSYVIEIGGRYASTGLTVHPYNLAAWCVLAGAILMAAIGRAGRPAKALVAAAVLPFAGVGLTMSRTGALAVVLVLACLAAASLRQPRLRVVVAAVVLASALGVALDLSGWTTRASQTAAASSATEATSDRTQLVEQAWQLWKEAPVLGVGPARYVDALVERPEVEKLATPPTRPVHAVPVLLLVEGGLLVLPALLLLGWAVAAQTLRAGILGFGITFAVLPFLFLDHLNWTTPQGLCLTAVWLGSLDHLAISDKQ